MSNYINAVLQDYPKKIREIDPDHWQPTIREIGQQLGRWKQDKSIKPTDITDLKKHIEAWCITHSVLLSDVNALYKAAIKAGAADARDDSAAAHAYMREHGHVESVEDEAVIKPPGSDITIMESLIEKFKWRMREDRSLWFYDPAPSQQVWRKASYDMLAALCGGRQGYAYLHGAKSITAALSALEVQLRGECVRVQQKLAWPDATNWIPFIDGDFSISLGGIVPPHPDHYVDLPRLHTYYSDEEYGPGSCDEAIIYISDLCKSWWPEMSDKELKRRVSLMYNIFAMAISQDMRWSRMVFLQGAGSNGKSVLIELIRSVAGRVNCVSVSPQAVEETRFTLDEIRGAMVNAVSEIGATSKEAVIQKTDLWKTMILGESVQSERKGVQEQMRWMPRVFNVFGCNKFPTLADNSDGMMRRLQILEFPRQFLASSPECKPLYMEMATRDKYQHIHAQLASLAARCMHYIAESGGLKASWDTNDETRRKLGQHGDLMNRFIATLEMGGMTPASKLWEEYTRWCRVTASSAPQGTQNGLGRRLKDYDIPASRGNTGTRCWHVTIKNADKNQEVKQPEQSEMEF